MKQHTTHILYFLSPREEEEEEEEEEQQEQEDSRLIRLKR